MSKRRRDDESDAPAAADVAASDAAAALLRKQAWCAEWAAATDAVTGETYYYHAATKAVTWDWPPPLLGEAGAAAKAGAAEPEVPGMGGVDFIPSQTFTGRVRGAVFKADFLGVGYYDDEKLRAGTVRAPYRRVVPEYDASINWEGARPGAVFKMGQRGLGYYRDDSRP
ncbi:hypothetical protein M885DRAFT_517423 [Pelagophyceae sp. CCMP2097]|nr:hypothetical protein M885DRAFT_517423 [Pelagophyceae sp. CCMP2097]